MRSAPEMVCGPEHPRMMMAQADRKGVRGGFHTVAPLILASSSPRRQRFLLELGLDFTVTPAAVDERHGPGEDPESFVLRLAEEKARALAGGNPQACVLAADTIVVLEQAILGKPRDAAHAEAMLAAMSGRWHEVWTGYCLRRRRDDVTVKRAVRTRVLFRPLTPDLCRAYVLTGEPLDKAGAYGLQGRGAFLVERIEGSHSNVIGLPMSEVIEDLLRLGVITPHI